MELFLNCELDNMARIGRSKKKSRRASKTLLMFGEGLCEGIFLKHLKGLYSYNTNVAIAIRNGRGGNARSIVIDAHRSGAYDRKIVVLDNDKPEPEMKSARVEAAAKGIELIENTPCLECLLLSIVEGKPGDKGSAWCKREFESKYLPQKKRRELSEYPKVFPKGLLDSRRSQIAELNRLIEIMEGK